MLYTVSLPIHGAEPPPIVLGCAGVPDKMAKVALVVHPVAVFVATTVIVPLLNDDNVIEFDGLPDSIVQVPLKLQA